MSKFANKHQYIIFNTQIFQMNKTEYFPLVDENGNVIGKASRQECHAGTFLLHPVVHLHVFNAKGELFLQKRSEHKDIQPGKWDTSVGGHVDYGEETIHALYREAKEELGIEILNPVFLYQYIFRSEVETELVNTYYVIYDGNINCDPVEISEGKFWKKEEILSHTDLNVFTQNFTIEFDKLLYPELLPDNLLR
jgi:isopentenyldiphosphate isomerase